MQERIEQALRRDAIDQALALAREWADSAPDEANAQRALAVVLARAGDPAAALVALDQAILLSPEDAGLHFERATLLLRSRSWPTPARRWTRAWGWIPTTCRPTWPAPRSRWPGMTWPRPSA